MGEERENFVRSRQAALWGVVEHSQKCFASHRLERKRSPPRRTRRSGDQGTCRCSLGAHCHSSSLSLSLSLFLRDPRKPWSAARYLREFLTSASAHLAARFFLFFGGTSQTVWVGEEEGGQKAMNDNGGSNGAEEAALTVWGRRRKKTRYKRDLGHSLLLLCRRKLHDVLPWVRRRGGLLRELVLVLWDET